MLGRPHQKPYLIKMEAASVCAVINKRPNVQVPGAEVCEEALGEQKAVWLPGQGKLLTVW